MHAGPSSSVGMTAVHGLEAVAECMTSLAALVRLVARLPQMPPDSGLDGRDWLRKEAEPARSTIMQPSTHFPWVLEARFRRPSKKACRPLLSLVLADHGE